MGNMHNHDDIDKAMQLNNIKALDSEAMMSKIKLMDIDKVILEFEKYNPKMSLGEWEYVLASLELFEEVMIEKNKEFIRLLNIGAKVDYPVLYASLDNNAVFAVARIINSMGFDFINYEDVFKQDFLAAAGYTAHYELLDVEYYFRSSHIHGNKVISKLEDDSTSDYSNLSYTEAMQYNTDLITTLYPVLWNYCSKNITANLNGCAAIDHTILQEVFNRNYASWLFEQFKIGVEREDYFSINTPIVVGVNNDSQIIDAKSIEPNRFTSKELHVFEESYRYICNLFENLTISLVKDCCKLINQIKINLAAGRDIMHPLYDTEQQLQRPIPQQQEQSEPIQLVSVMPGTLGKGNPKADISQDAINEMAATAEPELLNSLSAEKLMPSLQKNPYAQVETEYTDVEMDIVRYIMQDMIDAVKVV